MGWDKIEKFFLSILILFLLYQRIHFFLLILERGVIVVYNENALYFLL